MDKEQFELSLRKVVEPLVEEVREVEDRFVRELWMVTIDAAPRCLDGILFQPLGDIDFDMLKTSFLQIGSWITQSSCVIGGAHE